MSCKMLDADTKWQLILGLCIFNSFQVPVLSFLFEDVNKITDKLINTVEKIGKVDILTNGKKIVEEQLVDVKDEISDKLDEIIDEIPDSDLKFDLEQFGANLSKIVTKYSDKAQDNLVSLKDKVKEFGDGMKTFVGKLIDFGGGGMTEVVDDILSHYNAVEKKIKKALHLDELFDRFLNTSGGIFNSIKIILDALLFPKCSNSQTDDKKLRKMANELKPESEKFKNMINAFDEADRHSDESIDSIIRSLEISEIKKATEEADSRILLYLRNTLQHIANLLYKILTFIDNSSTPNKLFLTIKGLLNIRTTLLKFITIKFFCAMESITNFKFTMLKSLVGLIFNVDAEEDR